MPVWFLRTLLCGQKSYSHTHQIHMIEIIVSQWHNLQLLLQFCIRNVRSYNVYDCIIFQLTACVSSLCYIPFLVSHLSLLLLNILDNQHIESFSPSGGFVLVTATSICNPIDTVLECCRSLHASLLGTVMSYLMERAICNKKIGRHVDSILFIYLHTRQYWSHCTSLYIANNSNLPHGSAYHSLPFQLYLYDINMYHMVERKSCN